MQENRTHDDPRRPIDVAGLDHHVTLHAHVNAAGLPTYSATDKTPLIFDRSSACEFVFFA